MTPVEIIAHRGASYYAPENTRASVALAWHQNADAVEIDVHLSKDNEVIVMHDANTLRTTGFDAAISSLTLLEIRNLDAGAWKGAQFAAEPVPTLDEILAILPEEKRLFIEIKGSQAMIPALQASLQRASVTPTQIVLIGFSYPLMKAAKAALPALEMFWLLGKDALRDQNHRNFSAILEETIQLCREAGLDGLDVSSEWLENSSTFERMKQSGLKMCVYTVNNGALARHLALAGVGSITTDRPGWLREQLQADLTSSA